MNCTEVRGQLPLLVYGDLEPECLALLSEHLAGCPACRAEAKALSGTRELLEKAPSPPRIAFDMPRLMAELQRQGTRRLRRWQWAAALVALTFGGLAAAALAARFEMQLADGELTVRLGESRSTANTAPANPGPATVATPEASTQRRASSTMEEQLTVLSQIVQTMARDAQSRDEQQRRELARLQLRLVELQRLTDRRLTDTEKDLRTLYKAQFVVHEKGDTQ